MSRLVSENSGFAHVHHIITTNHIYLVNIDKLLYEILSLRCQLVMKFWRNRRCPTKSSFKSYFGEFPGHVETSQSRTMFYTPLKTCCPRENGSARRGAECTSRYTRGDLLVFVLVVGIKEIIIVCPLLCVIEINVMMDVLWV